MIAPHLDIEALSPLSAAAHDLAAPVPYNHTLERVSTPPSISGSALTAREAVFPCTPMAVCLILMSIPEFWATGPDVDPKRALEGKTIVIVNRYVRAVSRERN
jgi:5,10-methylene-tetrahydrofolate dehydrogenase/methenyl tetrahydrofolate cyclohydrolase